LRQAIQDQVSPEEAARRVEALLADDQPWAEGYRYSLLAQRTRSVWPMGVRGFSIAKFHIPQLATRSRPRLSRQPIQRPMSLNRRVAVGDLAVTEAIRASFLYAPGETWMRKLLNVGHSRKCFREAFEVKTRWPHLLGICTWCPRQSAPRVPTLEAHKTRLGYATGETGQRLPFQERLPVVNLQR
jgi:hypothetical protein